MNNNLESIPIERYIAVDAHKHYVMVGGLRLAPVYLVCVFYQP